jgi:hypothetical protein
MMVAAVVTATSNRINRTRNKRRSYPQSLVLAGYPLALDFFL